MDQIKRYDVILWDVDGTLLNFTKSERFALLDCLEYYGLPVSEEIVITYSAINNKCWKLLERGEAERSWILVHRFEELFSHLQKQGADVTGINVKDFQMRYQYKLGTVFYFQDDARILLEKLHNDFKQYIVTNGVEDTQRRKLALSGIADIVDDLFISECMGYEKPNSLFFESCVKQMQKRKLQQEEGGMDFDSTIVNKERILIVGDSLTSDMKGGNNFGIDCCYYHRGAAASFEPAVIDDVRVDYTIGNLWEVEQILWQNPQIKN